jgi:hypothetical protein
MHITRLSPAGDTREDRAIDMSREYSAEKDPLEIHSQLAGLSINWMYFDEKLQYEGDNDNGEYRSHYDSIEPLRGPRPQRLLQATFDQRSGEALLLVGEAVSPESPYKMPSDPLAMVDTVTARTASALGKPLGKPLVLPELRGSMERPAIARGGGSWLVMSPGRTSIHHEAQHRFPAIECKGGPCPVSAQSLRPTPEGRIELSTTYDSTTYTSLLDLETLLATPPRKEDGGAEGTFPALDNRGELRGEDGTLLRWTLSREGVASLLDPSRKEGKTQEETGNDRKEERPFHWEMHQVWGDVVVVATRGKQARATWLKARQTIDFETDKMPEEEGFLRLPWDSEKGPVLPGGLWLLPSTPGPLLPAPAGLQAALKDCPVQMPTGPRRLLLACSEATDDQLPTVRVGTRVVRY